MTDHHSKLSQKNALIPCVLQTQSFAMKAHKTEENMREANFAKLFIFIQK